MNVNNSNIVKLYFNEDGYSLVPVSNMEKKRYFLLDTGSTRSYIFSTGVTKEFIKDDLLQEDIIKIRFSLGNRNFKVLFIKDEKMSRILKDQSIIGLLGVDFFIKNKCIIDYKNNTFSWANEQWQNRPTTTFLYPLEIGIKQIGMPIVCMENDFSSIGCLIDTGSSTNLITTNSLMGFQANVNSNETSTIILCGKKIHTKSINVTFQIANNQSFPIVYSDNFALLAKSSDLNNTSLEPYFESILGNPFLRQNKWIIDFSNMAIYFF